MSPVSQCDNCRKLDPAVPPAGWLMVIVSEPVTSPLAMLTGSGPDMVAMFCSWRCAAEYATVRALVGGAGDETSGEDT